jgi:preprotein translocase subunit SecB
MSTPTNGGQAPVPPPPSVPPSPSQPQFHVMVQYTKDFSFENPNAPKSYAQQAQQPTLNFSAPKITPKQLSNTDFEVELQLEGKAEVGGMTLYAFSLVYAGLFHLQGIPPEHVGALVMIECPRLLYPFAREIVASAVLSGSYPPLLLPPIDFAAVYQQKVAQAQVQQPPAQA